MFINNEERLSRKREFLYFLLEEVRKSIYEWKDNHDVYNTTREQKRISLKLTILATIMAMNENSIYYANQFKLTPKEVEEVIDSYYRNVHLKNS